MACAHASYCQPSPIGTATSASPRSSTRTIALSTRAPMPIHASRGKKRGRGPWPVSAFGGFRFIGCQPPACLPERGAHVVRTLELREVEPPSPSGPGPDRRVAAVDFDGGDLGPLRAKRSERFAPDIQLVVFHSK